MKFLFSLALLAATWTAWGQGTSEAIQGYTYNVTSPVTDATAGWTFQTANNITVTDLGCFDYLFVNKPAGTSIQVGLWGPGGGSPLASDTVTPSSTPFNQTLYQSITPVVLFSGQLYHIGVYYNGTLGFQVPDASGGSVTASPGIQVGALALSASGFAFPAEQSGTAGSIYAGPNFRYQGGGVPEPSSWVLLGLGGLLLAARRGKQGR
jgi:hypothetical protein